jgi:hypothetical protein
MAYTGRVEPVWEAIFLLLILKIPLVYLCVVVWYAIRAEPVSGDGGEEVGVPVPLTPCGWDEWKRHRVNKRLPRPFRPVGPHARRLVAEAKA